MIQNLVSATFAVALAAFLAGCASETTGSRETGQVGLNILIDGEGVTSVAFEISGDAGTLSGNLNVNDENDPPIAATVMDLPPGLYTVSLTAFDAQGAALCTGSTDFTVVANTTVDANVALQCGVTGEELLGNVNITGEFELLVTNRCPRLHFLNAVPGEVPPEGSEVTVLVSDADGDTLATALTATSGSFEDPAAQSTTYTCGAGGTQTIRVSVTDGDAACDKTKSFDVECGGAPVACEYDQDFESLDPANPDALQNDGWLYFGNVFDSTGGFKFGFGPFPAPTTTEQISAIATGEGGPDQGNNQLVVFSNYECCDPAPGTTEPQGHRNGTDLVDTILFQEINPILASDIGRTFTFTFDAKRGNIGGATTAEAFIQTLDPNADFAITRRAPLDTTNLPTDWDTYSITLDLSDPLLEGQILQFGFVTTASNFEPAGNFYDNISFCAPGGGGGDPGIELRPLPEIYTTGTAINYGPYRAEGPEVEPPEMPSDADIREDLGLLQTAGYNLIRLFGGDTVSERILQIANSEFPEMRFQQGLFLEGLAGDAATNCDSAINDSQVATAIQLANTYPNVVTVSVGNETSFFSAFMPLNCLEGYITTVRDNVTQPTTANDDYTFYAGFTPGRRPDSIVRLIDFVSIHTYPFLRYQDWNWKQEAVPAGPLRAEAMMNASLVRAQDTYQAVYDYRYRNASGVTVTVGETRPIVIGETGWKWRQTAPSQEIETYAANPVNAKWYKDLMATWERSPGGPVVVMDFVAFDEAWKQEFNDDGWGFWDELRQPNYALCDTPAGAACNVPVYAGAGFYTP